MGGDVTRIKKAAEGEGDNLHDSTKGVTDGRCQLDGDEKENLQEISWITNNVRKGRNLTVGDSGPLKGKKSNCDSGEGNRKLNVKKKSGHRNEGKEKESYIPGTPWVVATIQINDGKNR